MTLKYRYRCYSHNTTQCRTPIACWRRGVVADLAHWLIASFCLRGGRFYGSEGKP